MSEQFNCQKHFYFKLFSLFKPFYFNQLLSTSTVFVHTQLNVKAVLFQAIQFNISTQFSSFWPIDRTLSDAATPGQSGPGSDANEGVLHIPQSSSTAGTSPSDCSVSYPGHSLMYRRGVLPLCRVAIGVFYNPGRQGYIFVVYVGLFGLMAHQPLMNILC